MRLVGYVRDPRDPSSGSSAFAQQEALRRAAADRGDRLVAVCSDGPAAEPPAQRDGYRSMLGVIASGGVDAVLVAGLDILSTDQIVQEIVIWDLRSRGVSVLSTDGEETAAVTGPDPGPTRMLIRDVLARVGEHREEDPAEPEPLPPSELGDVEVQLIQG